MRGPPYLDTGADDFDYGDGGFHVKHIVGRLLVLGETVRPLPLHVQKTHARIPLFELGRARPDCISNKRWLNYDGGFMGSPNAALFFP